MAQSVTSFALIVGGMLSGFLGARSHALAWTTQCTIGFDDNLEFIFENAAANSFANQTTSIEGTLALCPQPGPVTDTKSCWVYRHSCQAGTYISVYPQNESHYHLSFEDPTIDCVTAQGFGRPDQGGNCVNANWPAERRRLQTHDGRTWIEVAHKDDATASYRLFDMPSIDVGGTVPIQLWYQKPDGSVWGWSSLSPGNLDLGLTDVTAVWLRAAPGEGRSITINWFVVRI
jgi:hypothetical protein